MVSAARSIADSLRVTLESTMETRRKAEVIDPGQRRGQPEYTNVEVFKWSSDGINLVATFIARRS